MKNFILFLSLILLTGSKIKAQEFINFGVKGGLNLSNMTSDNFSENNMRTGFHLGILGEVPITNKFSLQPEVFYSTHGTEADVILLGGNTSRDYKLDYIQVPLLAKIYLTESLSIEAGPSLNFLVREKIGDIETNFGSSFEFGGTMGASYKLRRGFFGSARYIYGFTDALDRENSQEINNNGFQFGVGFMF